MMRRILFVTVFLVAAAPACFAQTVKTPTEADLDLAAVVQRLDRQSAQIEALAREVSRLTTLIETRSDIKADPAVVAATPSAPVVARPATPAPAATPNPAIQPPPGMTIHVVAKGENLTLIARKFGTSPEEIQKINKIEDDRKLQIGQNLIVPKKAGEPEPAASPAPSATPASTPSATP